jgi:hypothetical protein
MARSVTEGVCGSVEGRGILFDLFPPVEYMLASFLMCELMFVADREMIETVPLTGRME